MIAFFWLAKAAPFIASCLPRATSGKIYAARISVQGFCRSLLAKSKPFWLHVRKHGHWKDFRIVQ